MDPITIGAIAAGAYLLLKPSTPKNAAMLGTSGVAAGNNNALMAALQKLLGPSQTAQPKPSGGSGSGLSGSGGGGSASGAKPVNPITGQPLDVPFLPPGIPSTVPGTGLTPSELQQLLDYGGDTEVPGTGLTQNELLALGYTPADIYGMVTSPPDPTYPTQSGDLTFLDQAGVAPPVLDQSGGGYDPTGGGMFDPGYLDYSGGGGGQDSSYADYSSWDSGW